MRIEIGTFLAANSRLDSRFLDPRESSSATNALLNNGALRGLREPLEDVVLDRGPLQSIHLYEGSYWFGWDDDVDVARSFVPDDADYRIYWTGDGEPKMSFLPYVITGDTNYPVNSYRLGIPPPDVGLTLTDTSDAADPEEQTIDLDVVYVQTYVSELGEEGPPGPASTVNVVYGEETGGRRVQVEPGGAVPTGNWNIVQTRIYRLNASDAQGTLQLVATLPVAFASHDDELADEALGVALPSAEWVMPPGDLKGLTVMPNGILVGFRDNDLYFCEPYIPHAWPLSYRLETDFPIVSVAAAGNTLVIGTEGTPYLCAGNHPASMVLEKMESQQPCLSKNGMVDFGYVVAYPTPDGLATFSNDGPSLITEQTVDPEVWRSYRPETFRAARYENYYVAFNDEGRGIVVDLRDGRYVDLDFDVQALFTDPGTGDLMVYDGAAIQKWDQGIDLTFQWSSKEFYAERPIQLNFGKIEASQYPITLRYDTDTASHSLSVESSRTFRLPRGCRSEKHQFHFEGQGRVRNARFGEALAEVTGVA